MRITFKGSMYRVQFVVFDITNVQPDREVNFSVCSLPADANPYRAFTTGYIHYHGASFKEAWSITCKLLQKNLEPPKKLQKYNRMEQ